MSNCSNNTIPPITDPLGKHWIQPSLDKILIDDTYALMARATFDSLAEYSATIPSGVYPGKMWKRHDGLFDPQCKPEDRMWFLMWFGECEDPGMCSNNFRAILILE